MVTTMSMIKMTPQCSYPYLTYTNVSFPGREASSGVKAMALISQLMISEVSYLLLTLWCDSQSFREI